LELEKLIGAIAAAFKDGGIEYVIVGSNASMIWGEPRMTSDVDIIAQISPEKIDTLAATLKKPRFVLDDVAAKEIVRTGQTFNIIDMETGLKVDITAKTDARFDDSLFERRQLCEYPGGFSAYIASPEDTILSKLLFYQISGSDKHLRDVAGILAVSGNILDMDYLNRWAKELAVFDLLSQIAEKCEVGLDKDD